jgi:hypothetical protein
MLELINREIDGVCSQAESARVQEFLQKDPEARRLHRDLQALARSVQAMPQVEPPRSIKPAIMRALESKSAHSVRTSPSRSWWSAFELRPVLIFATGTLAGIALFVALNGLLVTPGVDNGDIVGTLILHGSDVTFEAGEVATVREGATSVTIETSYSPDLCLLRLRVESPDGVAARLQPGSETVTVDAVRPVGPSSGKISVDGNEVVMDPSESGGMTVLYAGTAKTLSAVRVTLTSSGKVFFDRDIALAAGGRE